MEIKFSDDLRDSLSELKVRDQRGLDLESNSQSVANSVHAHIYRHLSRLPDLRIADYFVVRNVLPPNLIPTPSDGIVDEQSIHDEALFCLGVLHHMRSTPIGYLGLNNGRMLRAVAPRQNANLELSAQTGNYLDWHNDAAYRPSFGVEEGIYASPDVVCLYAVRSSAAHPPLEIITVQELRNALSPKTLEVASLPVFMIESGSPWGEPIRRRVPIFSNYKGKNTFALNLETMRPLTLDARLALNEISDKLCTLPNQGIEFAPGDVVFLSNKTTVHRRQEFAHDHLGEDRYFFRLHAIFNEQFMDGPDPERKYMLT